MAEQDPGRMPATAFSAVLRVVLIVAAWGYAAYTWPRGLAAAAIITAVAVPGLVWRIVFLRRAKRQAPPPGRA